jgi:hypothetical protein
MTDTLHEAMTKRVAHAIRSGQSPRLTKTQKLKKRRPAVTPDSVMTQSLREAGFSAADARLLVEGHQHEVRAAADWGAAPGFRRPEMDPVKARALDLLQEQVGSNISAPSVMAAPTGWEEAAAGIFTHKRLAGHKVMTDGEAWSHRGPDGRIIKRGSGQQSLHEYAKTIPGDFGGSQNATEALDVVARIRARELSESPRPPAGAARLMEAVRNRESGRSAPVAESREDLRAKMYGKLVQP